MTQDTKQDAFTCQSCDELITGSEPMHLAGAWLCEDCYDYHIERGIQIHQYTPGFGKVYCETAYYPGLGFDPEIPECLSAGFLESTGGYGKDVVFTAAEGWIELFGGWTTGWIDHTTRSKRWVNELGELLMTTKDCPVEFYLASYQVGHFSLAVKVWCQAIDKERFEQWIEDNQPHTIKELLYALA